MASIAGFNYSAIEDAKTRKLAKEHARAIHVQLEQTGKAIVNIGLRLIEVHETIGRANFQAWLQAEFRWSQSVASNYMQCARKFGDLDCLAYLQPSALIVLARGNVPPEAVDEAIEQAASREIVTHRRVQELIAAHTPAPSPTPGSAAQNGVAGRDHEDGKPDVIRQTVQRFVQELTRAARRLGHEQRAELAGQLVDLANALLADATQERPSPKAKIPRTARPSTDGRTSPNAKSLASTATRSGQNKSNGKRPASQLRSPAASGQAFTRMADSL
ncbi:MAG: DUF3102 domain-containing protein [Planctomycetaceae bacterium]|nr:DUF3102 domain-containing protein [Planctomycetaceae bacterium]